MNNTLRIVTHLSLVTLGLAFWGGPACSSDDAKSVVAEGGGAGEAGGPDTAGGTGTGAVSGGGSSGKGPSAAGAAGESPQSMGGASSGGANDAGGGSTEAGASSEGGAGGAATMAVVATIPQNGGDVPVELPGGEVVTFTFPASAAGEEVTLTPTDATSIGWPAEQFTDVITMEPDGLTFADPVVIRLASKSLMVLDFSSSGTKGGGQGLPLNQAGDGLLLRHFSTLAVVPSGKSCDSTSGWHATADDARCVDFGAATTYLEFGCKGYNFCQLIQAHCCAAPGATECQVGDADATITYTDSDGNGTYAYCKPTLTSLAPTSGVVGANVVAAGADWDSYFASNDQTHAVSNVVFYNQQGIPVYPQGDLTVFTQDTTDRNSVSFTVPDIAAGAYDVAVVFGNGIGSTRVPFTITQ